MNTRGKEFVVSVADFAFYVDEKLACTGMTNLSTTISVSMQEQAVNAGIGNSKIYSYKYGRELTAELEAANWKLEYIAMQTGSLIQKGLKDFYVIGECVTLTNGVGTLAIAPLANTTVGVELPNGTFVEVTPTGSSIDLTKFGLTTGTDIVKVTYRYNTTTRSIAIDNESAPFVGKLVLKAEKHNSKKGKVGVVEVVIPSFSLDGNFDISLTPEGVASTNISGSALAVDGDTCADGNAVYAYINELDDEEAQGADAYAEIAIVAPAKTVVKGGSMTLSVVGILGAMYKPVELETADVTLAVGAGGVGTISGGVYSAGDTAGTATITATYGTLTDSITVTVVNA